MLLMAIAFALFLVLHRGISATPLRARLIERVGEVPYRRTFAIVSFALLAILSVGYWHARGALPAADTWPPGGFGGAVSLVVLALAVFLIVAGLSTRNPATAGLEDSIDDPGIVRGALRITRHPFLWGISLMSLCHVVARPVPANLLFFGALGLLALTGTASIDAKRTKALGDPYRAFMRQTSNIPFAAIATGRQQLEIGELGAARIGAALVSFFAILGLHEFLLR